MSPRQAGTPQTVTPHTPAVPATLRWDVLLRYRLLELVALWEGRLTTGHLCESFGIGRQQASKDINTYLKEHAPGNLVYCRSLKGYQPSPTFRPRFCTGSADEYLQLLHHHNDLASCFTGLNLRRAATEVLLPPLRDVQPALVRPVIQAARERKRLEIGYVSLSSPEPEYRVICPHTLVHTGYRWHVRAYCEKHRDYRDFVLSRMIGEPDIVTAAGVGVEADTAWNAEVSIHITPDPRLSKAQQAVIARDYGMENGTLVIPTRGALVGYVLQLLRLDLAAEALPPEAQQIVVANHEAVLPWCFG